MYGRIGQFWSEDVNRSFVPTGLASLGSKSLIFIGLLWLFGPVYWLCADPVFTLRKNTAVKLGGEAIVLSKGASLTVLTKGNLVCVVSVTLPDGTPLITQIPSDAISMAEQGGPAGRTMAEKVTMASVPSSKESRSPPVVVSGSEKEGETDEGEGDVPVYPRFELPSSPSDALLPGVQYAIQTGTFLLPIDNTTATVVYAVPMEGGEIAKSASNLIFYGPYPNEKTNLTGNIVPDLVRKLGCTVFSFRIEGIGQNVSDKPYWLKEAGWFDAALRARKVLTKKFDLERKKLILLGYSGGGGMVMDFAGAVPDQIEAVAAQAPDVVPPFPSGNKIKWLMVVNRGDTNRAVMKPFYEQLRLEKCQALYCETTPDRNRGHYHSPSGQSFDLIYSFIAGILDQRRLESEGVDDTAHLWPYVAPSSPLQRYAVVKTSDLEAEDLQNRHFDFLPSLAFTLKWSQVCPPEQNIKVGTSHTKLTINYPARATPAGVILYYDNPAFADVPREVEDINSLAEHGFLVISTMTAAPDDFVSAASVWVKSQDQLSGLHIHLVGNGAPGAHFIAEAAERNDLSFKSLSVIDFGDSWLQTDYSDRVASAAKECGMFGFFSYSASGEESELEMWANGLVDRGAQDRGCFNVCSRPVGTVAVSEAERHKQAEDQALTLIKGLIARADAR